MNLVQKALVDVMLSRAGARRFSMALLMVLPAAAPVVVSEGAMTGDHHFILPLSPRVTEPVIEAAAEASDAGEGYVLATGLRVPIPEKATLIHPGARIVFPKACTIGFILGAYPSYSLLTAAHCVDTSNDVYLLIAGTVVVRVGSVISREPVYDYAIVAVEPWLQDHVDPTIPYFGGPHGVFTGEMDGTFGTPIAFVGHPWPVASDPSPPAPWPLPRVGQVHRDDNNGLIPCRCPFLPGDSGGPIVTLFGQMALGIVTKWAPAEGTRIIAMSGVSVAEGSIAPTHSGALFPCADGRDNDGDAKVDWPSDPHCQGPLGPCETTCVRAAHDARLDTTTRGR